MQRKGALDVSINSIVVIIFAITMLGLGLAFIRGQFGNIEKQITLPEPDIQATPSLPIIMPRETIIVNPGENVGFKINFYNGGSGSLASAKPQLGNCDPSISGLTLKAIEQSVNAGSSATFQVVLEIPQTASVGKKSVCSLTIGEKTKQFFIEVK